MERHFFSLFAFLVVFITYYQLTSSEVLSSFFAIIKSKQKVGPPRLAKGWTGTTPTVCGLNCLQYYPTCASFMFNSKTKLCTPGGLVTKSNPVPTTTEGDLYYKVTCDYGTGFEYKFDGESNICIGYFKTALNYTDSEETCLAMGGYLATVKTTAKLALIKSLIGSDSGWLGCDDFDQPGTYVWQEDGEVLTNRTKAQVFKAGEPDNASVKEHCVQYEKSSLLLKDSDCTVKRNFYCELLVPLI